MTRDPVRLLCALGLASLAAYVLACASFSPDDSKVLFTAFDAKTGDVGVSLYDRQTRQLEQIFVPSRLRKPEGTEREAVSVRPQYLPDGKRCVVAWPGYSDNDDDVLNVAVLPVSGPGTVRLFAIPGIEDAQSKLFVPPVVAGRYFCVAAESNLVIRLNLDTGETTSHLFKGQKISLLPSWRSDTAYYVAENASRTNTFDVGRLEVESFAQTLIWQIPAAETKLEGAYAISPDGQRFALVQQKADGTLVKVWRGQELEKNLRLNLRDEDLRVGSAQFSLQQDALYAAYGSEKQGRAASFGLMKISLGEGALERVPLIEGAAELDKDDAGAFQVALSHDGKTAALCSTWLARGKDGLRAEDCALFLVDISDAQNHVTRVPLPLPKKSPQAEK